MSIDADDLTIATAKILRAMEDASNAVAASVEQCCQRSDNALSLRRQAALLALGAYVHAGLTHYGIELENPARLEFIAKRCWAIADELVRQEAGGRHDSPAAHPPRGKQPMGPAK